MNYFKIDAERMLFSLRFWVAVLFVPCILLAGILEDVSLESDVCGIVAIVMYSIPSVLILLCGSFAFADSFCEDIEHKYMMQQILRGGIKQYVAARLINIFLGAMAVTALGLLLYACILRIWFPWNGVSDIYEDWLVAGRFTGLLSHQHYVLYFLMYGIQYGALVGILALWSAYISLFAPNRMLVWSFPVIGFYFFDNLYSTLFPGNAAISLLFTLSFNAFKNDWMEMVVIVSISLVHIILLYGLVIRRIRRRYYE